MNPSPSAPEIKSLTADHCFAIWDRVLILIWRGEVTDEGVAQLTKTGASFTQSLDGTLACLAIVEATSPPPRETVRKQLAAFHRGLGARMPAQIVLAEGSSFRAALVRSVGVALSAISPSSLPFKFAATFEEAAALIAPFLSASAGGAVGLGVAVRELRRQF